MKKLLLLSIIVLSVALAGAQSVYVTPAGQKYHKKDCPYLKGSTTKVMSIGSAKKAGYHACTTCFNAKKSANEAKTTGKAGTKKVTTVEKKAADKVKNAKKVTMKNDAANEKELKKQPVDNSRKTKTPAAKKK